MAAAATSNLDTARRFKLEVNDYQLHRELPRTARASVWSANAQPARTIAWEREILSRIDSPYVAACPGKEPLSRRIAHDR